MHIRSLLILTALFLLAASASAQPAFTPVVDTTNTTFHRFGTAPALNSSGLVVFFAERGTTYNGAFTRSVAGGAMATIADSDGPFSQVGGLFSINGIGEVAFTGTQDAGDAGVYKWTAPTGISVVSQPANDYRSFGGPPQINTGGSVAFFATRNPIVPLVRGIYAGTGASSAITVADITGPFNVFGQGPTINAAGTVVFQAGLDSGNAGLYRGLASGGATSPIIENDSSPLNNFDSEPSLNATGRVVFRANADGNSVPGLYAINQDGTGLTTLATVSGPYSAFESPVINARGTVVFRAFLDAGGHGIFVGPDPVADRVIATGDPLFGSTVASLGFSRGLNDLDQLAFSYQLADGRSGIAVAGLAPVPEPAALLLIGAAVLGGAFLRRRCRARDCVPPHPEGTQ